MEDGEPRLSDLEENLRMELRKIKIVDKIAKVFGARNKEYSGHYVRNDIIIGEIILKMRDIIAQSLSMHTGSFIELIPRGMWGMTEYLGVKEIEEDLNQKEDSSLEMEISHRRDQRVISLRK